MTKRYTTLALIYAIIAMIFGVFYREFTKFSNFTGDTNLSVIHTHYFMLGMFFFLILMLIEKSFFFTGKNMGKIIIIYQVGLNVTGLAFLIRGLTQVWSTDLSPVMDALISGMAGVGHILIGICIILILLKIRKKTA